jgi:hypothetical protein
MIEQISAPSASSEAAAQELPRRDYLLLPLIGLATLTLMFAGAEGGARWIWPESGFSTCVAIDMVEGLREKPNCQERLKNAEGPWVSYHYNECGYRTYASCGPKPAGTIRIALLGSSISQGLEIPFDQTFGERAARQISRATGRRVEVQNLGIANLPPFYCGRKLDRAMALHPDLVVYAMSAFDLYQAMDLEEAKKLNDPRKAAPAFRLRNLASMSRAMLMASHFRFSDPAVYLNTYLQYGSQADFLRVPFTPAWRKRLADFAVVADDMAARLKREGIPFLIMAVPSRAQAALLHTTPQPPHTDPLAFGRAVQAIAEEAGAGYIDGLSEFQNQPGSERLFYIADGHIDPDGHALLARAMARKCLDRMVLGSR